MRERTSLYKLTTMFNRVGFLILLWGLPSTGWTAEPYSRILESIKPGTITFIGETHQKKESIQLIQDLLSAISQRHECLTLALEIDDGQQPAIDRVIEGKAEVSTIKIPTMIDHPALREFIADLAGMKARPPCVRVKAIDAGIGTGHRRDEWMAERLAALPKDTPILVLIGGLHTLKRVNWTVSSGAPFVAEILDRKGYHVKSFPEHWTPAECQDHQQRNSRFIGAESPEALSILNDSLISLMNATPHTSAVNVIDGVLLWECGAAVKG